MESWLALAAILIPWLGALVIWWAGDERSAEVHAIAVAFSLVGAAASLLMLPHIGKDIVFSLEAGPFYGMFTFALDGLGVFLSAVACVVGALAVIFSVDYMKGEDQLSRYYALILLFIGAMVGLSLTGSMLLLFFFWEITAFCSYALISFYNDDPKAVAGGMKALIMTQLGGVGLFVGALAVHSAVGSFQIADFLAGAASVDPAVLSLIAFGFLFAAAAKSAQVPFHTWLPGAMEAPTPISALIHAATMVNAGVYLLARFYPAFEAVPGWTTAVVAVGVISAFMAALMALFATDLKRVLAYSTISQLGYMVYAVGVGGIFASQFHLLSHAVFKALLFLAAGAVIHTVGTRDMREMGGLGKKMPLIRNTFVIGALALAGIPVLNGFWSKELILEAGLEGGAMWAYVLMLLGAGLTALYTFRMVWMVFFGERHSSKHVHDAPSFMAFSLTLLAAGTLTTWLLAGPFGHMLETSLPFHTLHVESTRDLVMTILTANATWVAMFVVAVGVLCWVARARLAPLANVFGFLGKAAEADFGFEALNRAVVRGIRKAADGMSITQSGILSWNVLGIVGGLILTLAFLAWGV